ncbi:MAG: cytochrome b/b6 domain-containing protein [Anaerolineae bacterium]
MTKQAVVRWVAILLVGAILATAGVFLSIRRDESARDWVQITNSARLGGSDIYANGVLFARAVPFLMGFGIAVGLLQAMARRRQSHVLNGDVTRHERSVVIMHWITFLGMVLLWFTAVLMLPGVLFDWAEKLLGTERIAELEGPLKVDRPLRLVTLYGLHYIGAALVLFASFNHLALHLVSRDRGLLPRKGDMSQALVIIIGYLGVFGPDGAAFKISLPKGLRKSLAGGLAAVGLEPNPAGKYLATERIVSYWPAVVLIGVLVVTGVMKAIHYMYPIPGSWRQFLTTVHDVTGVVLVVWLFLHVAAVVLVPGHWPLMRSMVTTRVPRKHVEEHHPLWFEELRAEEHHGEIVHG